MSKYEDFAVFLCAILLCNSFKTQVYMCNFNEISKKRLFFQKNSKKTCKFILNNVKYSMCDMTYDEAGGYSNTAVLLISVENVRIWNLGAISHSTGVLCPVVVLTG